jgi:GGDEF domain-containing protein
VNTVEIVIWSAMLGALLLIVCAALADVLRAGSIPAWRGLAFVLLTSGSAVLMTGLPEFLLGITDERLLLPLKVSMGPLSGALALTYLGIWVGGLLDDRLLKMVVVGGAFGLLAAAAVLAISAINMPQFPPSLLLGWSAAVNYVSVVMAGVVAVRGLVLGDSLAAWMVAACLCLAVMVAGLYVKGLQLGGGMWLWVLTAIATVGYFLIVMGLTLLRNRSLKRLRKLALGDYSTDEITGLNMGSVLVGKVDDAMWRSMRVGRGTAVIALWIDNLYALSDTAGIQIESEIRSRLTAKVRRAVGFRHVTGLMQARCYMVAISAVQDRARVLDVAQRILIQLQRPIIVGELIGTVHTYIPLVGIGIVHVPKHLHSTPLPVMDLAQTLAMRASEGAGSIIEQEIATQQ